MRTIVWKIVDKKGGYLVKSNRGDKLFVLANRIEDAWTFCENHSFNHFGHWNFITEFVC